MEIKLSNTLLKSIEAMKVIGVMFDKNLNWKTQAAKVLNKCSSVSYSIKFYQELCIDKLSILTLLATCFMGHQSGQIAYQKGIYKDYPHDSRKP